MLNLPILAASSNIAGLQSVGTVSGSVTIEGTIPADLNSVLYASFTLDFPLANTISMVRFQAPQSGGVLPNYWYPITSYLQLDDEVNGYLIVVYIGSSPNGRTVNINLVNNLEDEAISVPPITFNAVAELFSYPF